MKLDSQLPVREAGRPEGDNPLFNLPAGIHNFFLDCGRCATEGGEPAYYRWSREERARRAAAASKPSILSSPATTASEEAPRA